MQDLLKDFLEEQGKLAKRIENKFKDFFINSLIPLFDSEAQKNIKGISSIIISTPNCTSTSIADNINKIGGKSGLYVILTDYDGEGCSPNGCGLNQKYNDATLRAIYRGHSRHIRDRVMGHISNKKYIEHCESGFKSKLPWGSFMKMRNDQDGVGGINISDAPYCDCTWGVIYWEMKNSNRAIRELAENGFSTAFGTPPRSMNEKS